MAQTKRLLSAIALSLLLAIAGTAPVSADHSASTNYQVNETFFGSGGELNATSTNYQAKESAGELTVGNTKSTNYQAQAGFNSDRYPYLEFTVNAQTTGLGVLTNNQSKTATAHFSVRTYLASGYVVQTASDPPQSGNHYLTALSTPTSPDSTSEQFGINLVANTSPTTFGANPGQVPDATFGFGQAASGYNTPNKFKYVKGDTIASSASSSGETDFTISYLFNTTPVTPAGTYTFNHVLVVTATF